MINRSEIVIRDEYEKTRIMLINAVEKAQLPMVKHERIVMDEDDVSLPSEVSLAKM